MQSLFIDLFVAESWNDVGDFAHRPHTPGCICARWIRIQRHIRTHRIFDRRTINRNHISCVEGIVRCIHRAHGESYFCVFSGSKKAESDVVRSTELCRRAVTSNNEAESRLTLACLEILTWPLDVAGRGVDLRFCGDISQGMFFLNTQEASLHRLPVHGG